MKILFFIESLRAGGKERRLVELLKCLSKYENIWMELVLLRRDIHYTEIFSLNIKIHYIEGKYRKKDPSLFCKVYRIARNFKPDIIHVWSSILAVYAIPTGKLLNVKFINGSITYALPVEKFSKLWLISKIAFPPSDTIVANSKAGLRVHHLKQSQKHLVIYNGYDFRRNDMQVTDLKKELEIPDETVLVGMIGSFSDAKDYKTYIEVVEKIVEKNSNVHFLCVGNGVNRKNIEALVRERQINNVHFLGIRSDIENICKNLDIGVLLNNTNGHAEGISNAIMEYMAAGLPVIATNAGGTPELVCDEESGFLVPAFSPDMVAEKILFLLENRGERVSMGKMGMERIRSEFSLEKMVSSYLSLYSRLIDE